MPTLEVRLSGRQESWADLTRIPTLEVRLSGRQEPWPDHAPDFLLGPGTTSSNEKAHTYDIVVPGEITRVFR